MGVILSTDVIRHIAAVQAGNNDVIVQIAKADIITTAVGPQVLAKIAATIAKDYSCVLKQGNHAPVIIACENMVRGTSQLKQAVLAELPAQYHSLLEQYVGFVDSAVDRIATSCRHEEDPLAVTVESFGEWIVDKNQFKGRYPAVQGMELTDNLLAYVERKLFTLEYRTYC